LAGRTGKVIRSVGKKRLGSDFWCNDWRGRKGVVWVIARGDVAKDGKPSVRKKTGG